jgi:nucleoside-diphosphate-sugar epimerase
MYGAGGEQIKTESSTIHPLTAYAKSKCLSEKALKKLADDNFSVTCLRFSTACGMSPRLRLDLVLNDFVASAITSSEITVLSDGSPWRPLIHVKDMARAFQWAIFDFSQAYLAINIGDDTWNYQIKELAECTAKLLNVKLNINTQAASDNRSYKVSFEKFKILAPDYQPQVTLEYAINDLAQGLTGFTDKEFRTGYLMRLHTLTALVKQKDLSENLLWLNK